MPRSLLPAMALFLSHFFCNAQFENYSEIWSLPSGPYDAFFGNGVSVFDYDGDHIDNITIARPYIGISGFQVSQGQLTEDFFFPLPLDIKQLLWADFNNDGDKELFVTAYGSGLYLFDYSTEGLVPIEASFSNLFWGFHYGASAADYDNDGDLDLYVCEYLNYNEDLPFENLLFRNDGDFTFTEVGQVMGVNAATDNSFQSVWVDFNRDGWQDLYVINDHSIPNLFYQNNAGLSFTEISVDNNTNVAMSCMSNSVSDFNRDGYFDIFITDGLTPVLLKGDSSGIYSQVAYDVGFNDFQTGWGALWIDDNLDGWEDIHICQGGTVFFPFPNQYYRNENGTFTMDNTFDMASKASYVNAKGDFDGDNIPDFVAMHSAPVTYDVWRGITSGNNYVKIKLSGTASNRDAAGALIEVYSGDDYSIKTITMGDNYISQNSNNLIFGLESAQIIDSLVITWPLGSEERYFNIPANNFYEIVEGQNQIVDLNSVSYNIVVCHSNEDFVVTPNSIWTQWEWSDGQINTSMPLSSDTTVYAQAWNNSGQSFDLIFNVSFSPNAPDITIENYPCVNQESLLKIEENTIWSAFLNGSFLTSDSINLSEGNYFLHLTNEYGCSIDTFFTVELFDPFNLVVSTNEVCPNSLTTYSIASQNQDLSSFSLLGLDNFSGLIAPGIYPFTLFSGEGCQHHDTLIVSERLSPQITLLSDTLCSGDFEVDDFHIDTSDDYNWTFQNQFASDVPHVFTFEFTDDIGCLYEFSQYAFVANELNAIVIEDTLENYSLLSVIPSGGLPPYSIVWENEFQGSFFEAFPSSTVSYSIEDSIGCYINGEYTAAASQSTNESYSPFSITFDGTNYHCTACENRNFELYSPKGELLDAGRFHSPFKFKSGMVSGFYLLKIENYTFKLIVL